MEKCKETADDWLWNSALCLFCLKRENNQKDTKLKRLYEYFALVGLQNSKGKHE